MSRIISFRGKLVDGGIETISLHTNNGSTGYRIVKLELMNARPGTAPSENLVKIFTVPQTAVDELVDFSDQTLIAAGYVTSKDNPTYAGSLNIIFDNVIFNQDITIAHKDIDSGEAVNYHIELEQMNLALDEATVATLKNIRNND
jgi:hypothetical protein